MNYITSKNDEKVEIRYELEAKIDTQYTGEEISNILTDKFEFMDIESKSSRSMYPDFEIVGASFEYKDSSGTIYPDKIDINTKNFNNIYEVVSNWFQEVSLNIPDKTKFSVEYISIESLDDTTGVHIDASKIPVNYLSDFKQDNKQIEKRLHQLQDFVYIDLFGLDLNIYDAMKTIDDILDKEYILIS